MEDCTAIILSFAGQLLFGHQATQSPSEGGWRTPLHALVGGAMPPEWRNPLEPIAAELRRIQHGTAALPENVQMDQEQLRVAIDICSSSIPLHMVAARAGAGKSQVLKSIFSLWCQLPGNQGLLLLLQPVRVLREETAREHLANEAGAASLVRLCAH